MFGFFSEKNWARLLLEHFTAVNFLEQTQQYLNTKIEIRKKHCHGIGNCDQITHIVENCKSRFSCTFVKRKSYNQGKKHTTTTERVLSVPPLFGSFPPLSDKNCSIGKRTGHELHTSQVCVYSMVVFGNEHQQKVLQSFRKVWERKELVE